VSGGDLVHLLVGKRLPRQHGAGQKWQDRQTDQGLGSSVAESAATAAASSAITAAFIKVGSNATAAGAFN